MIVQELDLNAYTELSRLIQGLEINLLVYMQGNLMRIYLEGYSI